jgi:hypothetical protein
MKKRVVLQDKKDYRGKVRFKSRMLYENVCLWKCSSFVPNSVGPDTKLMLAPNVGSDMILEGEDIGLLFGKEQPPLTSLTR